MDFLDLYTHLGGSHGEVRLKMKQALIDQISNLLKKQLSGVLDDFRVTANGQNRFRINAELSNRLYQFVGAVGLRVLREDGVEIKITDPSATKNEPTIDGWMDTTVFGKSLALPKVIAAINDALGVENAVEIVETNWLGWANYRVFLSIRPFRLLRKFIPAGIGRHFDRVRWRTTGDAFCFDFSWRHDGKFNEKSLGKKGEHEMNEQVRHILDGLIKTNFANLKGSSAHLHFQIPEEILNEILALMLKSQKETNPWLTLINAAHVKGAVSVDIKMNV